MSTTTLPPAPAPDPQLAMPNPARFVSIRASLLPTEITDKRRLTVLKRRLALGLVGLVVVMLAWYAYGMFQTSQAKSDLSSAQRRSTSLVSQQAQFGPLVNAQAQSASIKNQLTKLMVGDVRWKDMLATLRSNATGGVALTSVSATMTAGGASTGGPSAFGGLGVLNQTGKQQVGTLVITGTAPDKNAVAAFIDRLSKLTGLAAPFPANVSGGKGSLTFTANVIITSDALGGRYAPTQAQTQGGH